MNEEQIPEKFLKPYNPAETEGRIYKEWEEKDYFTPERINADSQDIFSMVLPRHRHTPYGSRCHAHDRGYHGSLRSPLR